jgi:soluble lytic murein transglycosylase-like protein
VAVRTHPRTGRLSRPAKPAATRLRWNWRDLPAWIVLAVSLTILLPRAGTLVSGFVSGIFAPVTPVAALFTPQVRHWAADIVRWAAEFDLDPNLLATVMQIESCGHPTVSSYAGAQGLFQVMPFHFASGENQLDPDTNAKRGASFLKECIGWADGDVALTLACYNGGPSVIPKPYEQWRRQTQFYVLWGVGIYADAANNRSSSAILDDWLDFGGSSLCQQASTALGL